MHAATALSRRARRTSLVAAVAAVAASLLAPATAHAAASTSTLDTKPARRTIQRSVIPTATTTPSTTTTTSTVTASRTATTAPTSAAFGAFMHMTTPNMTNIGKASVVVLQQHQYTQIPAIRTANPTAKIYMYSNLAAASKAAGSGAYQPSVITYPQLQAHPEWVLKDAAGAPAYWRDYDYLQPFDTGNAALQKLAVSNLKAELTAHGWDGVMFDDTNTSLQGHDWSGAPTNITGGSVYAGTDSFLRAVAPALRATGKKVAINLETHWDAWKPQVTAWSPLVDAVNMEHWSTWSEAANKPDSYYLTGLDAAWRLNEMAAVQAGGAQAWAHDYGSATDVRAQRFSRALFLMGWNGTSASASMWTPSPWTDSFYNPGGTFDLGAPSAAATQPVAKVYRRVFARGTLYLNTTTATVTVTTPKGALTIAPLTAVTQ